MSKGLSNSCAMLCSCEYASYRRSLPRLKNRFEFALVKEVEDHSLALAQVNSRLDKLTEAGGQARGPVTGADGGARESFFIGSRPASPAPMLQPPGMGGAPSGAQGATGLSEAAPKADIPSVSNMAGAMPQWTTQSGAMADMRGMYGVPSQGSSGAYGGSTPAQANGPTLGHHMPGTQPQYNMDGATHGQEVRTPPARPVQVPHRLGARLEACTVIQRPGRCPVWEWMTPQMPHADPCVVPDAPASDVAAW